MTDHDATVAAVLVDCLRALTVMAVEPDRNADALAILAGFTAAGYAVVKLPEGMAVEHGARLVVVPGTSYRNRHYTIKATP